eukprot:gene3683-14946_t
MAVARRIGKMAADSTAFFLCDMQEKFRPTIRYFPEIAKVANRLMQAAGILKIPMIATEQYPKGLGSTVSEIDVSNAKVFPKTVFSMMIPEVEEHLKTLPEVKTIVLFGIEDILRLWWGRGRAGGGVGWRSPQIGEIFPLLEKSPDRTKTHVCIQQTCLDLLEKNYEVHVVADSCSSRTLVDRMFAFERMKQCGAFITTSESVLFMLMKDAKHPCFKQVQSLVQESAPDSALLGKL